VSDVVFLGEEGEGKSITARNLGGSGFRLGNEIGNGEHETELIEAEWA
jgi:hypothetical protein